MFLNILKTSQENTCVGVAFNKVAGLKTCNFIKKDSKAGGFYGIFQNFKNTCFEEHLRATASECLRKVSSLVVLGKSMLDGKIHNWATDTFMNLMKLVCAIFTLHQNTFCYFFQASEDRAKVIMIIALKYFELPVAVAQL